MKKKASGEEKKIKLFYFFARLVALASGEIGGHSINIFHSKKDRHF